MPFFQEPLPLSLYVHIPWCVRKCPYCDFNSHEAKSALPESIYVEALMQEIDQHLPDIANRSLVSIFFGGGTPSLFSEKAIADILNGAASRIPFSDQIEITLEANPGTLDEARFRGFRAAGVNRLSIGIQSLHDTHLKSLGRIHDRERAMAAIHAAKSAGFTRFNLDFMYALPHQSIEEALHDLKTAIEFEPAHLSWYQLTIEPNTLFHHAPPPQPLEDEMWEMQQAGQQLLQQAGYRQYEVSAYALSGQECIHNKNYWEFGDYLGIGAGAHSKLTNVKTQQVKRFSQVKNPRDYLDGAKRKAIEMKIIDDNALIFEFMLNALRLTHGVSADLFSNRTGLSLWRIQPILNDARARGLLIDDEKIICPTALGFQYLNDVMQLFL